MKRNVKKRCLLILLVLIPVLGFAASTDYRVDNQGRLYSHDIITKGPWVDVRAFGAKGDGATDDSAAVQAAADVLYSTGGVLFFGPQTYYVKGPISVYNNTGIKGSGMRATKIYNASKNGKALFNLKNTKDTDPTPYRCSIEDIWLEGNSSSGDGVYVYAPFFFTANRVMIWDHGGHGINMEKGTAPFAYFQSIDMTNSSINTNRKGGIRLAGGGNLARISNCSINQNAYYGIYSDRTQSLQIRDCEIGGYYYGSLIPGHQARPIVLNGGASVIIEGTSFENNAGNGTTPNQAIHTGWDGDSQSSTTNTTQSLIIKGCYFTSPGTGAVGAINYIQLDYTQGVSIEENQFEKYQGYPYTINAVNIGTLGSYCGLLMKNNVNNVGVVMLAGNLTSLQYTLIDDKLAADGKHFVKAFGIHGYADDDAILWSQRPNYTTYDAFRINTNGKLNWGSGSAEVDTDLYRKDSNILKTDDKFIAAKGLGVGNASDGDVTGTYKIKKVQVFDADGKILGYLQVYQGP